MASDLWPSHLPGTPPLYVVKFPPPDAFDAWLALDPPVEAVLAFNRWMGDVERDGPPAVAFLTMYPQVYLARIETGELVEVAQQAAPLGHIEAGRARVEGHDVSGPHASPEARSRYMLVCGHIWNIVEDCTDGWFVQCRELCEPWLLRRDSKVGPSEPWELIGPTHYLGALRLAAQGAPTSSPSDGASA